LLLEPLLFDLDFRKKQEPALIEKQEELEAVSDQLFLQPDDAKSVD
jgi:hypothetical protein